MCYHTGLLHWSIKNIFPPLAKALVQSKVDISLQINLGLFLKKIQWSQLGEH